MFEYFTFRFAYQPQMFWASIMPCVHSLNSFSCILKRMNFLLYLWVFALHRIMFYHSISHTRLHCRRDDAGWYLAWISQKQQDTCLTHREFHFSSCLFLIWQHLPEGTFHNGLWSYCRNSSWVSLIIFSVLSLKCVWIEIGHMRSKKCSCKIWRTSSQYLLSFYCCGF